MCETNPTKDLISVIMPCYNQAQYLSEALESVMNQTYPHWECIIIDDGSTDGTKDIASDYCKKDNRIKYMFQENQGVVAARNNAIKISRGEYLLPLDGDDKIAPSFMEKTLHVLQTSSSDVKVAYSKIERFGIINQPFPLPHFSRLTLLNTNCLVCTALFRREDYDKTGGYNPNMKSGFEDWDFWLSMFEQGGTAVCIPEVLFYYRKKEATEESRNNFNEETEQQLKRQLFVNHPDYYFSYFDMLWTFYEECHALNKYKLFLRLKKHYRSIRNALHL